jgi:hypothetical protein
MGELNFMTLHYAEFCGVPARLTNADFFEAPHCFVAFGCSFDAAAAGSLKAGQCALLIQLPTN